MRTAGLRGQHRRRLLRRLRLGAGGRARSRGGWAHNPGAAGIRAAHGVDPFQFDALDLHPVQPVGRGHDGRPGRTEGFCPRCGTGFSFTPKLSAGDLVAGQYEVLGCLAHGGLGWVYDWLDEAIEARIRKLFKRLGWVTPLLRPTGLTPRMTATQQAESNIELGGISRERELGPVLDNITVPASGSARR